jgi:guanylate kinase
MTSFRNVYVVVAPSGVGKTTLNSKLLSDYHDLIEISVSYTSRARRPNEVDGSDCHFVTKERFEALVSNHEMLEWATVHGNLYGTPREEINRISKTGKKILLEIDYQGWKQAKNIIADSTSIFILPPSLEEMWHRLESRGTDSLEVRWKRLQSARREFESANDYSYFIINDELDRSYSALSNLIIFGKEPPLLKVDALKVVQKFLNEFDHAKWIKDIELKVKSGSK